MIEEFKLTKKLLQLLQPTMTPGSLTRTGSSSTTPSRGLRDSLRGDLYQKITSDYLHTSDLSLDNNV